MIIPELVMPNQQVASVQVSHWLQPLSVMLAPGDTGSRLSVLSATPNVLTQEWKFIRSNVWKENPRMEMNTCLIDMIKLN